MSLSMTLSQRLDALPMRMFQDCRRDARQRRQIRASADFKPVLQLCAGGIEKFRWK